MAVNLGVMHTALVIAWLAKTTGAAEADAAACFVLATTRCIKAGIARPDRTSITERDCFAKISNPGVLVSLGGGGISLWDREPCCLASRRLERYGRVNRIPGCVQGSIMSHGISKPVALVTGANRGLGRGLVIELAMLGYTTIACCRDGQAGREVADEVKGLVAEAMSFELDVGCDESVRALADAVSRGTLPTPDLVFNNAGVCLRGTSREVLERTLEINLTGAHRVIKALLPAMRPRGGCIVNVSSGEGELVYLCSRAQELLSTAKSVADLHEAIEWCLDKSGQGEELAFGDTPAYSVSKAGVNALTRILSSQEGAVRIVSVCPGDVDTPMCMLERKDGVLSADEAATDVAWVAVHPTECPSGGFYRARERIEW